MENKRLNVILITVSVVIFLVIGYMTYLIIDNENARKYFKLNDIYNIEWVNELDAVEFQIDKGRLQLTIEDEQIIDGAYEFDRMTGEFIIEDHENQLYMRNIGKNNIVIWYQKAEYHLTKKE